MSRAGPYLRTNYLQSNEVLQRPYQKVLVALILMAAVSLPFMSSGFFVHLLCLSFLSAIGALGLMLLTGFCGQISLGHAAFLAVGGYTTVILSNHGEMPFVLVVPAAALAGAVLGFIVGLPSLRFRGVYLAISTLAMHYAIIFCERRHHHSRSAHRSLCVAGRPRLVLFSAGGAGVGHGVVRQSGTHAARSRLDGDP